MGEAGKISPYADYVVPFTPMLVDISFPYPGSAPAIFNNTFESNNANATLHTFANHPDIANIPGYTWVIYFTANWVRGTNLRAAVYVNNQSPRMGASSVMGYLQNAGVSDDSIEMKPNLIYYRYRSEDVSRTQAFLNLLDIDGAVNGGYGCNTFFFGGLPHVPSLVLLLIVCCVQSYAIFPEEAFRPNACWDIFQFYLSLYRPFYAALRPSDFALINTKMATPMVAFDSETWDQWPELESFRDMPFAQSYFASLDAQA